LQMGALGHPETNGLGVLNDLDEVEVDEVDEVDGRWEGAGKG